MFAALLMAGHTFAPDLKESENRVEFTDIYASRGGHYSKARVRILRVRDVLKLCAVHMVGDER
jgi:hypothetical protein